jgi:ubiquinone biosynthesis protein COQ4
MRIKPKQLFRAFQKGLDSNQENLGDFAILKADALGASVNPAVMQQLETVVGYHPPINLEQLSTLPRGTLGYEYAHHMQVNQLKPFNVSPELEDVAGRNVFALRYAVTHDIFHVLLGFDTSYAGEMGVLAFAVAQNYSRQQRWGLWIATVLYPLLAPGQFREIFRQREKGWELGSRAEFLLAVPFEEMWHRPLNEVRKELRLPCGV